MTNEQKEIDKFYTCNSDRIKETEINKINPEAVDELAKQICRDCDSDWCRNRTTYCKHAERRAMRLYNAGYRKMSNITLRLDLGDRSAEEIQQIAEAFNKAMASEQPLVTVPSNEEEITKRVAKEILQELDSRYWGDIDTNADIGGAEHNQTIRSLKKWVQRKYGVEIEK